MLKRAYFLCLINIVSVSYLYAQTYNFVRYGIRDGLLHSLVTGITQDKRGDLWMSTGGGLCRFNGIEFKSITTRDGLNFTRLTSVAADEDDNIWVGSSKGINFIVGKTVKSVQDSLINDEVFAISSAGKSMIWALTNNGLFKVSYINDSFHVQKLIIPSFKSQTISQIFQDRVLTSFIFQSKTGKVLYGNNGRLFRVVEDKLTPIITFAGCNINSACELTDGSIILGSSKGLYKLNGESIKPFKNELVDNVTVMNLSFDGQKIWLLGKEQNDEKLETYLYSFDPTSKSYSLRIGKSNGLTDEPTQLALDHEGNVWTTSNNGVSIFKPNPFVAYTTSDGLIGNKIWGLYRVKDGSLYVGTIGEGLTIIKDNRYYRYDKKNGLPDNYVGRIFQSKDGSIYVGTSNAGLCRAVYDARLDKHTFTRLPIMLGKKLRIDDVVEDNQDIIWVATSKGLFYSDDKNKFSRQPLLKTDTGQIFLQKLLIDTSRNLMWIGTRYNGVFIKKGHEIKQFDKIDSKEEISSLQLDSFGNLWIGTRFNGVFIYRNDKIEKISEENGLSSNLVYILHNDKRNNFWVGTNLGLDRIELNAFQNDSLVSIRHYGSDNGLVDMETNLNGVFEDTETGFWIATNGGLLRYEHSLDKINNNPPRVQILSMKLNSQATNWLKFSPKVNVWNGLPESLILKHNQNHLTFEFVGVSFSNPKTVKYSWKLDGFDNEWISSTNHQVIYSNLPSGSYTFRLRAANGDGVWSEEVSSMPFTILKPFWRTWWFRIAVILFIGLLVYLYFLSRIKSLRDKQKELEGLVKSRTFELSEQFEIVDKKNKQILDSLTYAKFLQTAIMPSVEDIRSDFAEVFIYNRPKDFVSGDFYWYSRKDEVSVLAVADCTGHGVPGAIISVICENAIRQAVESCDYKNPSQILQLANKYVTDSFSHANKEIRPGMEIALLTFNHLSKEFTFSGAMLGMHVVVGGKHIKLKPSLCRIGWDLRTPMFFNETLKLDKGDSLFIFTDGFVDQFKSDTKKKFSTVRLTNLLTMNTNLPFEDLHDILNNEFKGWQGDYDQIDDVLVVGIKI